MLDRRMIYSCAYWQDADDLDAAQEAKLDLICRKLRLQPGMKVLDIGCGWGGTLQYAAERYGVEGVGVTVSTGPGGARPAAAASICRSRSGCRTTASWTNPSTAILSVGMFEHVGVRNYRVFMTVARRCLGQDGLFLLHTIGSNRSDLAGDVWIDRYIFPNAKLPSARQISEAAEGLFVLEDLHNIGANYDPTLMAWNANLEPRWDEIPAYDERFRRMWRYYLLACAGTFRARSEPGVAAGPVAQEARLAGTARSASTAAGGADRDRTDDLRLAKPALSQLSYCPCRTAGVQELGEGRNHLYFDKIESSIRSVNQPSPGRRQLVGRRAGTTLTSTRRPALLFKPPARTPRPPPRRPPRSPPGRCRWPPRRARGSAGSAPGSPRWSGGSPLRRASCCSSGAR